jgi:hypothetical protein
MHRFSVEGPFNLPFAQGKAAKTVSSTEAKLFWDTYPHLAARRGCYIFAIRAGRGMKPAYVGKATKSFQQEVFTPDKLSKYQRVLANYLKGTPILFFIVSMQKRGAPNASIVGELEDYLIQTALSANEDLLNVQGTKRADFCINGVLRSGKGKRAEAAKDLMSCLKLT